MHELRTGLRFSPAFAISVFLFAAGCGGDASSDAPGVTRDTLPDGTVVVRYPALPIGEPLEAVADLRMGSVDDDPYLSFADVRGIEAASDGTIYVLDYQLSEVRAFDADGNYLRTVATPGEGPGEISEANGFVLVRDSILWIQDHGKWAMLGVTTEGEEVGRYQMPVRSYGYIWSGTIDDTGRLWRMLSHSDEAPGYPPPEGLVESTFRGYLKWYDPETEATDSIFLGPNEGRSFVYGNARGGFTYRSIPFGTGVASRVDPAGGVWLAHTSAYRVARLDSRGDTVLVIEADVAPLPVTETDRAAYAESSADAGPEARNAAREVASLMPEVKPVIEGLVVDDLGRLWVDRVVPLGETPLYDVFERDGDYLGSIRLAFEPNRYLPIRIRDGRLYALVQDELDIPFVVRADVPVLIEATETVGR